MTRLWEKAFLAQGSWCWSQITRWLIIDASQRRSWSKGNGKKSQNGVGIAKESLRWSWKAIEETGLVHISAWRKLNFDHFCLNTNPEHLPEIQDTYWPYPKTTSGSLFLNSKCFFMSESMTVSPKHKTVTTLWLLSCGLIHFSSPEHSFGFHLNLCLLNCNS